MKLLLECISLVGIVLGIIGLLFELLIPNDGVYGFLLFVMIGIPSLVVFIFLRKRKED
jgi:hypothetical protein